MEEGMKNFNAIAISLIAISIVFCIINLFILYGCASTEPPREYKQVQWKPDTRYRLFKNDSTKEFYVKQERPRHDNYWNESYWSDEMIVDGDSAYCVDYVKQLEAEKTKEINEAYRQAMIKRAWHEVKGDSAAFWKAIFDSAEAQTDRELKPQIDALTKTK